MRDAWPSTTWIHAGAPVPSPADDLQRLIATLRAAFDSPGLTAVKARRLAAFADDAARMIRTRHGGDMLGRLQAERDIEAARVEEMASELRRRRTRLEAALSGARAGMWQCRLSDEALEWSGGVYDLFDIRPGARLHRNDVTGCYTSSSLTALNQARDRAIRTGGAFALDAEVITISGARRWIRLTGRAEHRNGATVRVFGLKQDVTEERAMLEDARRAASTDPLTGLANRGRFQSRLAASADADREPIGALLMVDLDGFKAINDSFGHSFGDACLRTAARRLTTVCHDAELVARIGGDEFAVLLGASCGRDRPERVASGVVEALSLPVEHEGVSLRLGASVGVAHARGCSADELFTHADAALYAAKAAGRGTFRCYSESVAVLRPAGATLAPAAAAVA